MNIFLRIGNSYVNGFYRYNSKLPSELTGPLPPIQDLFFFGGGGGEFTRNTVLHFIKL